MKKLGSWVASGTVGAPWIYETVMALLATWKQRGLNPSKAMAESISAHGQKAKYNSIYY
ncbi:MAG: hypothetical protein Q8O47_08470 [Candidatus Bathyarchaeota archaeon]|nr:hypothetical protein [Candidatus Bathyarchaeota archaeon]